jgi:hypothetical protein
MKYKHYPIAAQSFCTAKYVRQYFQTGEMPAENTVCEVDDGLPFIGIRSARGSIAA